MTKQLGYMIFEFDNREGKFKASRVFNIQNQYMIFPNKIDALAKITKMCKPNDWLDAPILKLEEVYYFGESHKLDSSDKDVDPPPPIHKG